MKIKLVAIMIALFAAKNSYGLSRCPHQVENCGKNPFAVLVVGFSQVCSERKPANAEHYEAAVAAYFTGHSEEYEKLGLDPEFPKKLHEFRKVAATMSHAELESECTALLSKGKNTAHPDELRK